eukprot:gene13145-13275_t
MLFADDVKPALFKPMLILVGDSITEFGFIDDGWGLQLARAYSRKADVINRGFGGYTSKMGVYLLDEFLNSFGAGRIRLVTLGFGANDASLPSGPSGWMSVPLPEFKANLAAMVKKLRDKGITNIVIMTPPPINDAPQLAKERPDKSMAYARDYSKTAISVAKSMKVPFVDLQTNIMRLDNWQATAMKPDGVHLTYAGQKVVFDALMFVITKQLKGISPYALPVHMPVYTTVNKNNPGSTFDAIYGYKVNTGVVPPPPEPSVRPPSSLPAVSSASGKSSNATLANAPCPTPATNTSTTRTASSGCSGGQVRSSIRGAEVKAAVAAGAKKPSSGAQVVTAKRDSTSNGRAAAQRRPMDKSNTLADP